MLVVADRVLEFSTTQGIGAYQLNGAIAGYRTAGSVCANGDFFNYYAEEVDGNGVPIGGWETGLGTWGLGGTLTRTAIYASSNANVAVNWGVGIRRIGLGVTAPTASGGWLSTTATESDIMVGAVKIIACTAALATLAVPLVKKSYTVAALPSASTSGAGACAYATDANATTYNSVVAGSGSNKVPVVSDGTNWRIG